LSAFLNLGKFFLPFFAQIVLPNFGQATASGAIQGARNKAVRNS